MSVMIVIEDRRSTNIAGIVNRNTMGLFFYIFFFFLGGGGGGRLAVIC